MNDCSGAGKELLRQDQGNCAERSASILSNISWPRKVEYLQSTIYIGCEDSEDKKKRRNEVRVSCRRTSVRIKNRAWWQRLSLKSAKVTRVAVNIIASLRRNYDGKITMVSHTFFKLLVITFLPYLIGLGVTCERYFIMLAKYIYLYYYITHCQIDYDTDKLYLFISET